MTKQEYIDKLTPLELARHKASLKAGFVMPDFIHANTKYVYSLGRIEVNIKKPAARFKIDSTYSNPRYTNLDVNDILNITKFFVSCGRGQRLSYKFVKKEVADEEGC